MNSSDLSSLKRITKKAKEILSSSRSSCEVHTSFLCEERMAEAVRNGNAPLALQCLHILDTSGKSGTLSSNPLRQAQYIFVSHITLITRAAIQGGMRDDLAFALSDSFIQTGDTCTSVSQIHQLRELSVAAFCRILSEQKNSPPYSKSIRKAIQHIQSHLSDKLSLEILCEISGLSLGRFSHLFKIETGMSPMAYVMKTRIDTAMIMLTHSSDSISDISLSLGFYNESHFIKHFKKQVGITPAKYRFAANLLTPGNETPEI